MRKYNELRKKRLVITESLKNDLSNMSDVASESRRVADVSKNIDSHIKNIDLEFKQATGLSSTDIKFLVLATGLQTLRWWFQGKLIEKMRITSEEGDKLVSGIVPKRWHDILLASVPYDATKTSSSFKENFESTGLSGYTHRYRTLGHDPILGWFFGPMNILSDSLTKHDFISTYHVETSKIIGFFEGGTMGAINCAHKQAIADKLNLPAAITRQALHFGSDYFTKQGLPIPVLSSVNNDLSKDFLTKYNIDMLNVTTGLSLSVMINKIIELTHRLFFDEKTDLSNELYEVRTRKILIYSNAMASTGNVLYIACSKDLRKLDIGGYLATLHRVITDHKFIQEIKQDFLKKELYKIVIGNDFDF